MQKRRMKMAKIKRGPWNSLFLLYSAERLGFEPRVPVRVRRISSAVHSTTLASLLFSDSPAKVQQKVKTGKRKEKNYSLLWHFSLPAIYILLRNSRVTAKLLSATVSQKLRYWPKRLSAPGVSLMMRKLRNGTFQR